MVVCNIPKALDRRRTNNCSVRYWFVSTCSGIQSTIRMRARALGANKSTNHGMTKAHRRDTGVPIYLTKIGGPFLFSTMRDFLDGNALTLATDLSAQIHASVTTIKSNLASVTTDKRLSTMINCQQRIRHAIPSAETLLDFVQLFRIACNNQSLCIVAQVHKTIHQVSQSALSPKCQWCLSLSLSLSVSLSLSLSLSVSLCLSVSVSLCLVCT
jgi:hypothetical protein